MVSSWRIIYNIQSTQEEKKLLCQHLQFYYFFSAFCYLCQTEKNFLSALYQTLHNLFVYTTMSEASIIPETLLKEENPLISLYIIKKALEEQLVREIHINSYLQTVAIQKGAADCKIQENSDSNKQESHTQEKINPLRKNKKLRKLIGKVKNDTKNIPKNYGKAIISFIEQKQELVRKFLLSQNAPYDNFISILREKKKGINSIADLRNLWLEQHFIYAKQMRTISLYFLRKASLNYVFTSRIANQEGHIRYRFRLIEVLRNPQEFTSIKTN